MSFFIGVCYLSMSFYCTLGVNAAHSDNIPPEPTVRTLLPSVHECSMIRRSAIWDELPDDDHKDFMWVAMEDANRCLGSLTITNEHALFTLISMKYGVAELHDFADIVNGLQNSVESNNCGFKLHSLDVDMNGFIDGKLEEFWTVLNNLGPDEQRVFLEDSIQSAPFHFALQRGLNRLNDAHTRYRPPFVDFHYIQPIRFKSRMQGETQVVTLDITDLAGARYHEVYGESATLHSNGDIITEVNGKPVLKWMEEMVSDDGPYVGANQDPLQRLNRVFFVDEYLNRDLRYQPPPTEPLNITFADGFTESVKWLARLNNYTKFAGPDAISWEFYNNLTNRNRLFQKSVEFDTEFYSNSELLSLAPTNEASTFGFDTETLDAILQRIADNLMRASPNTTPNSGNWIVGPGYQYRLVNDTVVVSIPSFMLPETATMGDYYYSRFPEIQDLARKNNVTRLLLDMSSNKGGIVTLDLALQWYLISNADDICVPFVRRMTANWQSWVESFGTGFNDTINAFFDENSGLVGEASFIHEKFEKLYAIWEHVDEIMSVPIMMGGIGVNEVARLKPIEESISSEENATSRASAFRTFMTSRSFVDTSTMFGKYIVPTPGWYPFDNVWYVNRTTQNSFDPPLNNFIQYSARQWGKSSNYSAEGALGFCYGILDDMPAMAKANYDRDYWTDVAFVTDGNCGSACSSFVEALQLTGRATAFTFGALSDQPMDVSSYGSANVIDYSTSSSRLNIASYLGYWATFGESDWAKKHATAQIYRPLPLPNSARVSYAWNIALSDRLGPEALPRQFYRVPPHKHLNMWARNLDDRALIHEAIVSYKNWSELRANPQFKDIGYCPTYSLGSSQAITPVMAIMVILKVLDMLSSYLL